MTRVSLCVNFSENIRLKIRSNNILPRAPVSTLTLRSAVCRRSLLDNLMTSLANTSSLLSRAFGSNAIVAKRKCSNYDVISSSDSSSSRVTACTTLLPSLLCDQPPQSRFPGSSPCLFLDLDRPVTTTSISMVLFRVHRFPACYLPVIFTTTPLVYGTIRCFSDAIRRRNNVLFCRRL